ncbi:MAG: hypothetical protein HY785_01940 [Oscillatoriophycideae cyanobacterium NC_groundwater_1537_Pr4_S-0.65um_50_18]|nr:hypothetical protein [Oscillatoriophycideae cyanobacterium NC_groundwater_1537_Pr4_S-0.65um_50_18]
MVTQFLTVEVALQSSPALLQQAILAELKKCGEPLRWAIVAVNGDRQMAIIEAVVTVSQEFLVPEAAIRTA